MPDLSSPFVLIVPTGTQIVTRIACRALDLAHYYPPGAVGVIVNTPVDHTHSYRIRFPDGQESTLLRHQFSLRKQFQSQGLASNEASLGETDWSDYIIFRCVVGSRAYGLDHAGSDTDRRGIYVPPADAQWSLFGVPEQLESKETEECYWEIQKFLILALKANPNVLECLYSPLIETATPLAEELLGMRSIFLSRLVYQTYNGYVMSQFKKLEQDLRSRGSIKWKHAMHLIRLLLSGITTLREGFVPVQVAAFREQLLAIRNGELDWAEINAWRLSLHQEFDRAFEASSLPERPDYEKANAFLIHVRRSQLL
ncbi:MAG TPA: nucleotidyltransferase domain-containing protein [Acidobacteriota bacterium]|nr:nucleotidyltransferase domain-containing protein [Acidobacteriota bacterium]